MGEYAEMQIQGEQEGWMSPEGEFIGGEDDIKIPVCYVCEGCLEERDNYCSMCGVQLDWEKVLYE